MWIWVDLRNCNYFVSFVFKRFILQHFTLRDLSTVSQASFFIHIVVNCLFHSIYSYLYDIAKRFYRIREEMVFVRFSYLLFRLIFFFSWVRLSVYTFFSFFKIKLYQILFLLWEPLKIHVLVNINLTLSSLLDFFFLIWKYQIKF